MKHLPLLSAALLLPAGALAAPVGTEDRIALESLARSADDAWNRRDAAAMSLHYSEDSNLLLGGMAEPVRGRGGIKSYFERAFAARTGDLRHRTLIAHIEVPQPGLAVSDARVLVESRGADGSWTIVREFTNTGVAVRGKDGWKLAAVRAQVVPPTVR